MNTFWLKRVVVFIIILFLGSILTFILHDWLLHSFSDFFRSKDLLMCGYSRTNEIMPICTIPFVVYSLLGTTLILSILIPLLLIRNKKETKEDDGKIK